MNTSNIRKRARMVKTYKLFIKKQAQKGKTPVETAEKMKNYSKLHNIPPSVKTIKKYLENIHDLNIDLCRKKKFSFLEANSTEIQNSGVMNLPTDELSNPSEKYCDRVVEYISEIVLP